MALPVVPLNSLDQDDQNMVQNNYFAHVPPLALVLVSHDANSIINDTTVFVRSRQLN